jgi:hypothetical protein
VPALPASHAAAEADGAQLFQQLVLIERFDLLKFLGTDPKTAMWIGLSILFHQHQAALSLYRLFFLELSHELQVVARSLQRLSWAQQAAWSAAFLSHHMSSLPAAAGMPVSPDVDDSGVSSSSAGVTGAAGKGRKDRSKKQAERRDDVTDAGSAASALLSSQGALFDEAELDISGGAIDPGSVAGLGALGLGALAGAADPQSLWTRPDLTRAVYFSGYPNYPPELTRLTRRKLEDVLANLSFLALLASTLSLDSPRPAALCFHALASRGCLPLSDSASSSAFPQPHLPHLPLPASSTPTPTPAASASPSSPSSLLSPPQPSSLRINMNSLVFPQLMFEVWVNLPLVFFEMTVAPTRRARALVVFYHAMRTCLLGECNCCIDTSPTSSASSASTAMVLSTGRESRDGKEGRGGTPCYICYWQLMGARGQRVLDLAQGREAAAPSVQGVTGATNQLGDGASAHVATGIEWWKVIDHVACQALGLVRLADVRDIDQVRQLEVH